MPSRLVSRRQSKSWDHLQRAIPSSEEGPGTLSHQLVAVHVKTDGGRSEDKFYLDFKSDHIRDRIRDQLGVIQIRKALSMLRVCLFVSHTASLGGLLFECLAHQYLSGLTETPLALPPLLRMQRHPNGRTFRVDDALSTAASTATRSLPIRRRTIGEFQWDNSKDLELTLPLETHFYIPKAQNNPLLDSFMIEYNGNVATLWIFQMTVGKTHGGSARGYDLIASVEKFVRGQLHKRANAV
ncbi:hypothetical protein WOLCODRAFT_27611, partial [Wolfiporia cocos MD-104 SS10]